MSASQVITLDLHPPVLRLGPVPTAGVGEPVAVPYIIDEPEVVEASLGGRPMTILAGWLLGHMPLSGRPVLRALVRDSVDNAAEHIIDIPVGRKPRVDRGSDGVSGRTTGGWIDHGAEGDA